MRNWSDQQRSGESLLSSAPEPGRGDRIVGALVLGVFYGFCAAAIAWGMEASPVRQVLAGLAGALVGVAVASLKPLWTAGSRASQAFRRATEEFDGPRWHGEAIQEALGGQGGMLALRVAIWAIAGGFLGAMAGGLPGMALGTAAGASLGLAAWSLITTLTVLIVRTAGLPLGGAIMGGLCGAIWGMELWKRWWHVPWPNIGALALGVPMALLFALVGRERRRLKRKRTKNGS